MRSPPLAGGGQVAPKMHSARRKLKKFSQPISTSFSLLLSSCFHFLNFCFSLFHLKSHFLYPCPSPWLARCLSSHLLSLSLWSWAGAEVRRTGGSPLAAAPPKAWRGVGSHIWGVLGQDPVRNLLFPLSRPCLPVWPTSPAPSPWKPAADFLLVGGRGGGGEGRAGSPLLNPRF